MNTKQCADCRQTKPLSDFPIRSRDKKPYSYCRECDNRQQREKHQRRKQKISNPPAAEKHCPDCGLTKPGSEFYLAPINADGLSYCCKPCWAARAAKSAEQTKQEEPTPVPGGHKKCGRCGETKPVDDFHKNRRRKDHLDSYCKKCKQEIHPDKYLRHAYGIDTDEYNALLLKQGGVCAICGNPEKTIHLGKSLRLSVDHCHTGTKKVRGLLCYRCNHLVGYLERSQGPVLEAALKYLQHHS